MLTPITELDLSANKLGEQYSLQYQHRMEDDLDDNSGDEDGSDAAQAAAGSSGQTSVGSDTHANVLDIMPGLSGAASGVAALAWKGRPAYHERARDML